MANAINGKNIKLENGIIESSMKNLISPTYLEIPYIKIVEQPASKALRFRYECEGRSAGSIPGIHSTLENKTFPTIQIVGCTDPVVIVVSCVTKDEPYKAHPHHLVGKDCKEGIYTLQIHNESMTAMFSNLGIQCIKKKDIEEALKLRQKKRVDPFKQGFTHGSDPIDLNAVRLCFQGFLKGSGADKYSLLRPVVTDPIYDKKAMSDLVITKLSHSSATVAGGQEIILLCEKVDKKDILVRFYEEEHGKVVWEGFGDVIQVHKQVAICFKTPQYNNQYRRSEMDEKVKAFIQLKRSSDKATSEPLPFFFVPADSGKRAFYLLRSLKLNYDILANILADPNHSITKQLLALQRNTEDTFVNQNDSYKFPLEMIKVENVELENTNENCSSINNDNDYYEKKADVLKDPIEIKEIDEIKCESNMSTEIIVEPKIEVDEFSAKETVNNLPPVTKNKRRELGMLLGEQEEYHESLEGKHFREFIHNIFKPKNMKKENMEDKTTIFNVIHSTPGSVARIPNYEWMKKVPPRPSSMKPNFKKLSIIPDIESETRPPLPPKRIKKNSPLNKSLPTLPQKDTKLALIQKFFFSRKKKSPLKIKQDEEKEIDDNISCKSLSKCRLSISFDGDSLTEAEHYALYTSVAPQATDSEFDEISCYYSPVETEPIK